MHQLFLMQRCVGTRNAYNTTKKQIFQYAHIAIDFKNILFMIIPALYQLVNINIEKKQIIKPESPTLAMKRNRHPKKGDIYIMTKYFKNVKSFEV